MVDIDNKQLRVLVVEDSVLTARQIREILEQIPFVLEIETVETQEDAIACGEKFSPHVVILDLQLKEGNGFGVLREFAKSTPKPNLLVLTNYALPNYRNYAFLTGADFFLDKAKDTDMLKYIVESLSRNRSNTPNSTRKEE